MSGPELLWLQISAMGQVAGAAATFAAVVVALHLARAERRIRIKVSAWLGSIVDALGSTETVSITVQNVGLRQAKVDGIGWIGGLPTWSIPDILRWLVPKGLQQQTLYQIHDYGWAINEAFPWRLQPGESKSTHFKRAEFFEEFTAKQGSAFFRRIPLLGRIIAVRPRVFAAIDTQPITMGSIADSLLSTMKRSYLEKIA